MPGSAGKIPVMITNQQRFDEAIARWRSEGDGHGVEPEPEGGREGVHPDVTVRVALLCRWVVERTRGQRSAGQRCQVARI